MTEWHAGMRSRIFKITGHAVHASLNGEYSALTWPKLRPQ